MDATPENPNTSGSPQSAPDTPPSPPVSTPAKLLFALAIILPAALGFQIRQAPGLLAPLASPWAAHLVGHTCGLSDYLPIPSLLLALAGPTLLYLATRTRLSRLRYAPFALWYTAWILAAWVSLINTTE